MLVANNANQKLKVFTLSMISFESGGNCRHSWNYETMVSQFWRFFQVLLTLRVVAKTFETQTVQCDTGSPHYFVTLPKNQCTISQFPSIIWLVSGQDLKQRYSYGHPKYVVHWRRSRLTDSEFWLCIGSSHSFHAVIRDQRKTYRFKIWHFKKFWQ